MLRRLNALLRERGILKGEPKYYVSLAHTHVDIRFTRDAWVGSKAAGRPVIACAARAKRQLTPSRLFSLPHCQFPLLDRPAGLN